MVSADAENEMIDKEKVLNQGESPMIQDFSVFIQKNIVAGDTIIPNSSFLIHSR